MSNLQVTLILLDREILFNNATFEYEKQNSSLKLYMDKFFLLLIILMATIVLEHQVFVIVIIQLQYPKFEEFDLPFK